MAAATMKPVHQDVFKGYHPPAAVVAAPVVGNARPLPVVAGMQKMAAPAGSPQIMSSRRSTKSTSTSASVGSSVSVAPARLSSLSSSCCGEGLKLKPGDKVQIRPTIAAHAGKWAIVDGRADDENVRVRLECSPTSILCLSPMHLDTGDGSQPIVPPQPGSIPHQEVVQIPRLRNGSKVRLGGDACPEKFHGRSGFVVVPDVGDGTGRAKIRLEPTYSVHEGFISTGGTFLKEMMTVEEAKAKCAMMGGVGFTHKGGETLSPVLIYLKNKWDCNGKGWTSYRLEEDPEGLPAWILASHLHLTLIG